MGKHELRHGAHTTWRCQYHLVFAPKFRRKAIYGELRADIGKILRKLCEEKKVEIELGEARLKEGHPNTVELKLKGVSGKKLDIIGESIGGGRINIAQIDGIETNFSGENPTLIVHNQDQPGHVAEVTSMLAQKKINIATLQLYRSGKGGRAVMVVECDQDVPEDGLEWLEKVEGIIKVTYLKKAGGR